MEEQLARLRELKLRLVRLGYQPFQIEAIQRDVIGDTPPEAASQAQRQSLIAALDKYIYFASRNRVGCGQRFGPDA